MLDLARNEIKEAQQKNRKLQLDIVKLHEIAKNCDNVDVHDGMKVDSINFARESYKSEQDSEKKG